MRIRSIRPEFWSSEDVAKHDLATRLLFIGLWSYVDDNGVGRDVEKLISAELFPLEEDPRDTLATVSRGLQSLSDGGQITRYTVGGKPYLHITAWDKHQKIDRPAKDRYPLPTRDDASIRDTLATPSRDLRDSLDAGEGEKGRRGEVKRPPSPASAVDVEFEKFWAIYPRKVGKGQARTAYRKARKQVTEAQVADALKVYVRAVRGLSADKIRHGATWLNGEPWHDDPADIRPEAQTGPLHRSPSASEQCAKPGHSGWASNCAQCRSEMIARPAIPILTRAM